MKREGIILAAGKGTRMPNNEIPKVMYKLKGRPMVEYLVKSLKKAGVERPILVVGYRQELLRDLFEDSVDYVVQDRQLGTGHAVIAAEEKLKNKSGSVLIAYGDMPLWSPRTIEKLFQKQEETEATLVLATLELPKAFDYGRIIRDREGKIIANVEAKDCTPKQLKIKEKNPSLYLVDIDWLFRVLKKVKTDNVQGEYYLTDIIAIAVEEGQRVETVNIKDKREAMGVNTKEDYQAIQRAA